MEYLGLSGNSFWETQEADFPMYILLNFVSFKLIATSSEVLIPSTALYWLCAMADETISCR